jgi:hypothetical protein
MYQHMHMIWHDNVSPYVKLVSNASTMDGLNQPLARAIFGQLWKQVKVNSWACPGSFQRLQDLYF